MEVLLRYALFKVAMLLISIEVIILLGCTAAIIAIKAYFKKRSRREKEIEDGLTNIFIQSYLEDKVIKIPWRLRYFRHIVKATEHFEHRIDDPRWSRLKEALVKKYLLSKARSYIGSNSWIKRQLAARTLYLVPSIATEQHLEALLHDSKYLVRVVAANTITKISSKKMLYQMINQMSRESRLSRFAYRDALLQMNLEKFGWLRELLATEKRHEILEIVLDLFGTRTAENLFPHLLPFIYGDDFSLRLLAVKALKQNPSNETNDVLIHCFDDKEWKIRAEALKSLDPRITLKELSKVKKLLADPEWNVRLQAGLALKKLGEPGMRTLSEQTPHASENAYEISRYVMALPS